MKIVEPSAELLVNTNNIDHVCKCAHICYASEEKSHEKNEKFYKGLKSSGHLSVLRHESYYYKVSTDTDDWVENRDAIYNSPYIAYDMKDEIVYISTNGQYIEENQWFMATMDEYRITAEQMYKECPELVRYTFLLATQISTSRELARHSPQNFTEQSTRYIKFGGKVEPSICKPWWFNDNRPKGEPTKEGWYVAMCREAFDNYNTALETWEMKPEDARGLLPLDTITKVIMTHNVREWRRIIDMRYFGSTGRPHPNIKLLIGKVKEQLENIGYEFKDPKES